MTLQDFVKLILSKFKFIAGLALALGVFTIWITQGQKKEYVSHTLLNTGLISGYNIESQQNGKVDYAYTNNEIENLINLASATETSKELALRLLARTIISFKQGSLAVLDINSQELKDLLSQIEIANNLNSEDKVYEELVRQFESDREGVIYELLHSKHKFFSLQHLAQLQVLREGKSDMIKMEYKTIDPYICQSTLSMLTEIFLRKHKEIKEGQTESVIGFFEEATQKTADKLNNAENRLLEFSVNNKIINYYEQTRFISGNKQELDKKYQEEIKVLAAADSALGKLDKQLANQSILPVLQEELFKRRDKLSDITSELAIVELIESQNKEGYGEIRNYLISNKDSLEAGINFSARQILELNSSPEGMHTSDILNLWLNNHLVKAESEAKIEVMKQMRSDFDRVYQRFAPLGSTLKRLEREIDVAEREYLENLHSFNQARLHKYNMMLSSNLKVIDPPYFPAVPEKSKRILMIILATLAGGILSLSFFIASELLNTSIKNPKRAKEIIGLPVAGSLPLVRQKGQLKNVDYDKINSMALNLLYQKIWSLCSHKDRPIRVALMSHHESEGKSYISDKLKEAALSMGLEVAFEQEKIKTENSGLHQEIDYVFHEIPSVLSNPIPAEVIKNMDLNILVCNAARSWTESDEQALKILIQNSKDEPYILLNGVAIDDMESVIGEIPKKRTKIRKYLKNLILNNQKTAIA